MISIIVPAYNEVENIEPLVARIRDILDNKFEYEIIFVDDGSNDQTLTKLKSVAGCDARIKYIALSRNFGHQKALKAGLDHANGECVISLDADLQHPPEIMIEMIDKWKQGYDVVYTIRKDTKQTRLLKRFTSKLFYQIVNVLSGIDIPVGAADFRLIDKKVVNEIKKFKENWLFLRGIICWLGFRQIGIEYQVQPRHSGSSKYSIGKMIAFAIQGITSFSIFPLRIATFIGICLSFFSFLYGLYALYEKLFTNAAIQGWTSMLMSVLFLGGVQLISLGLIGEYLGKMFIETKERPVYVIKEKSC